ncbi:MAG: serine/threonine-protein kinase [Anaerolineae bacterium]|jgi:serine/threonine-protein kinase|nr:serine/threonine-protein kinase [Anaerolineae bacterium]MDX9829985.1 serine/threonine-protein kinase [Anaerolineae bacterium]
MRPLDGRLNKDWNRMSLKPGDTLLNGQYQIVRQLGRGGFGFVYLAQDRLLGEQVALKELIPALVGDEVILKRFLAEARATIRLTHERIVRTYNVFSEAGNYYIAMEYMAGGGLDARLQAGPLRPAEAARIAADVAEGLHYAHGRGVVHCDLKPANILFAAGTGRGSDSGAKVADFGIAHVSDQLLDRTWHTSHGFVAGTLPYMSPEQAEGVRDDPRIDVYALGAVLYRMLTGRSYLDFDQRTTPAAQVENVMRIRRDQAPPPSTYNRAIPRWLDAVVLKALAKDPAERYATAGDLRRALLRQEPAAAEPARRVATPVPAAAAARAPRTSSAPAARRPLPRSVWLLAGGGVVVCLVLAIVAALLLGNGGGEPTPPVTFVVVSSEATNPAVAPTVTTTSPPTAPPDATPLPSPTPPPPSTLYADDFSDENSGWGTSVDNNTEVGYAAGEYRIAVKLSDYMGWGQGPDLAMADYELEVDTVHVAGPLDNNYGPLVRYQDETDEFYWFQISSDGYYAVDLYHQGEFSNLVTWEPSEAINQGLEATNRVRVVCQGNQFRFYVNDVHLVDVADATLGGGTVGLAAGTFDEPGTVIHFDNLVIRALAP